MGKLGAIVEQYANNLLLKFRQSWKPDNPKYGQEERAIRIDEHSVPDHLLSSILAQMGIDNAVVVACFPANLIVYVNPGAVFYKIVGKQDVTHLWAGDVNADLRYSPSASGANLVCFQSSRSELSTLWASFFSGVPGQDRIEANAELLERIRTRLANTQYIPQITPVREKCALIDPSWPVFLADTEIDIQQKSKMLMDAMDTPKDQTPVPLQLIPAARIPGFPAAASKCGMYGSIPLVFSFTPADKEPITAVTFKETRFGSHTPRIDHEFLNRLRQGAARKALLTPSPHPNALGMSALPPHFAGRFAEMSLGPSPDQQLAMVPSPTPFQKVQFAKAVAEKGRQPGIPGFYSPGKRQLDMLWLP